MTANEPKNYSKKSASSLKLKLKHTKNFIKNQIQENFNSLKTIKQMLFSFCDTAHLSNVNKTTCYKATGP